jgi:hypothetical protein
MGFQQAMVGPPGRIGVWRITGRQIHVSAGTHREQPRMFLGVDIRGDGGPQKAALGHEHLHPAGAGRTRAQAATGTQSGGSDVVQRLSSTQMGAPRFIPAGVVSVHCADVASIHFIE